MSFVPMFFGGQRSNDKQNRYLCEVKDFHPYTKEEARHLENIAAYELVKTCTECGKVLSRSKPIEYSEVHK